MSTDFMNSSGSAWIIHESRLPGGGDDVACEGVPWSTGRTGCKEADEVRLARLEGKFGRNFLLKTSRKNER